MKKQLLHFSVCLMVTLTAMGYALAQDWSTCIEEGSMEGVKYITGGVGLEERTALDAMAKNYNLKLSFALHSGAYLSDLMVSIQDTKGNKLLQSKTNGPWFFVMLPKGEYHITVTHKDQEQVKKVAVGEGLKMVLFYWKG
jgi:hypothetical protein